MALNSPQSPVSPIRPTPPRRGGGCLIAAGVVIGPVIGLLFGETSVGLLAGLALGVLAAVALVIADRKR